LVWRFLGLAPTPADITHARPGNRASHAARHQYRHDRRHRSEWRRTGRPGTHEQGPARCRSPGHDGPDPLCTLGQPAHTGMVGPAVVAGFLSAQEISFRLKAALPYATPAFAR